REPRKPLNERKVDIPCASLSWVHPKLGNARTSSTVPRGEVTRPLTTHSLLRKERPTASAKRIHATSRGSFRGQKAPRHAPASQAPWQHEHPWHRRGRFTPKIPIMP